jgi:hypothetical protein
VIDSLDDLARLYYSSILFRNNGNCDNVWRGRYIYEILKEIGEP